MRNQGQLILASVIIVSGLVILIGNLFDINLWAICWPAGLILLGLWLLLRPQLVSAGTGVSLVPIGDIRRQGDWPVADEEFWAFVGDVDIDLTQAEIPPGETRFRVFSFVGDVELLMPAGVGFAISSTAFVSDVKTPSQSRDSFLAPIHITSDDYQTAERRVRLEAIYFVGSLKVRRIGSVQPT